MACFGWFGGYPADYCIISIVTDSDRPVTVYRSRPWLMTDEREPVTGSAFSFFSSARIKAAEKRRASNEE